MKKLNSLFKITFVIIVAMLMVSCQKQVDYGPQIQTLTNSVSALQAALNSSIASLQKSRDSLSSALTKTNANLTSTNTNVSNLGLRMDSVKTALVGINAQLTYLSLRIDSANTNIVLLNTQMATANSNITTINAQIVVINTNIANFTILINTLNQQYNNLLTTLNSILAQISVTPTSLSTGLIAWYPFTGNAIDSSGNGNNGTLNSVTLTTDRNGNANSAYLFAGNQNSYIDCGNTSSLRSVLDTMTISLWFKSTGGTIAPRIIDFGNGSVSNAEYSINIEQISGSSYKLITGYRDLSNQTTINLNTWYHVVFVVGKTQSSIYLNGVLINVVYGNLNNLSFPTSNWNLNIGRMNHAGYDAFAGIIDDVRIYNRVLTNTEISYLSTH